MFFMEFELTRQEISKLKTIDAEFQRQRKKIADEYQNPDDPDAVSATEIKLVREFQEKNDAIRRTARERTKKHYAAHLDKLIVILKDEVKNIVAFYDALEIPSGEKRSVDAWKNFTFSALSEYIELLNDNADEMKKFIEDAFNHYHPTSYSNLLQGRGTNAIVRASKKIFEIEPISGKATATIGDFEKVFLSIDNYTRHKFNVQTKQLFDLLTLKLTEKLPPKAKAEQIQKNRTVKITVDEFMTFRGLKDKKEARAQLEEAIKTIYDESIEFDDVLWLTTPGKKKEVPTKVHVRARIADLTARIDAPQSPIKNGAVIFKFTFDVAEYLSNSYIMPYPEAMGIINSHKNPHSYYLGRKFALHYNMNLGKENANRISVKSLLDELPDMPTYEEIMTGQRHVTERIIEPFERDLEALITYGILARWEYCNSKGAPLTDEQLENYSYNEWVNWLVTFELANYPDQSERLKKLTAKKEPKKRTRKPQPPIAL